MAHNSDAFFREVEEDLRHDRLTALWKRFGIFVILAAVALVAGTAGVVGWSYVKESRMERDALAFDRAIEEAGGVPVVAAEALALVGEDARTGYAVVARLTAAQIFAASGEQDAALDMLEQVAADRQRPELYRDLARLLALAARADTLPPDALITELRPFTATSPWRHTARELTAAALLRAGDRDQAVATLRDVLDDEETPSAMRGRVRELLAALDAGEGAGG
ncbi:MAG: hypothetical protein EA356_17460 [Geminicoccaceae bacterium]|nr:MAG: hypothetical protein EA356_17460 [Geminicoccaceae bacterium]